MKWEDTVKKYQRKHPVVSDSREWHMIDGYNMGAQAQAEISFKAGQEDGRNYETHQVVYNRGVGDGRREVVEWAVNDTRNFEVPLSLGLIVKLKEWGYEVEVRK